MKKVLLLCSLVMILVVNAQKKTEQSVNKFLDFSTAFGSNENSIATSYVHNWKLGKKKKLLWECKGYAMLKIQSKRL